MDSQSIGFAKVKNNSRTIVLLKRVFAKIAPASVTLLLAIACSAASATSATSPYFDGPDEKPAQQIQAKPQPQEKRKGHLIQIPLPITSSVAAKVKLTLERLAEQSQKVVRVENQPVIILQFDTERGKTGQGSDFESCLSLARFLSGEELNRLRTVAFIPSRRKDLAVAADDEMQPAKLTGHAVLVAIAADKIAIAPDASIGAAGIDEKTFDPIVHGSYSGIAQRSTFLDEPIVMAMVDKQKELHRAKTETEWKIVDSEKLKDLVVVESETLATTDQFLMLTGQQMKDFGMIQNRTLSKNDLVARYNLARDSLEVDPTNGNDWKAVTLEMPDYIDSGSTDWMLRALQQTINNKSANLLIFSFNSASGDPDVCLDLARRIAEMDSNKFRTVAFINDLASGPAAIAALACDQVVMSNAATLGGVFEPAIPEGQIDDLNEMVNSIAKAVDREPAIFHAMINPNLELVRFRNNETGQTSLMTNQQHESLDDQDKWKLVDQVDVQDGFGAELARKLEISSQTFTGNTELENFYQLEESPTSLTPTLTDQWLKKIAHHLASPFVAPWLLFGAFFFISTEMSQPGTGVPGFLGALCLVAFFWSQYLDGNANALEILMFLTGVVFVLLELFVIPGFGIFGIGGFLMVIGSLVLASQDFIFPKNSEEFNKLPGSLMILAGALGGMTVAVIALRTVLPKLPYFRKMMLEAPTRDATGLEEKDPESIVSLDHLVGRNGNSITNLAPAGKAMIDDRLLDVITDGRMIEKGTKIKVTEVAGNRVVVEPVS